MSSTDLSPFAIDIPQAEIDDLIARLTHARLPEPLPDDDWDCGVPVAYLRELVDHWRHRFSWREQEEALNDVPQFTTEIDGQRIHLVHVRSRHEGALPLLLTHGWPGSFVEFLDLIGPLTDPEAHGGNAADAFHVVLPSLPGFACSSPVAEAGWTTQRIAGAWVQLMDRLGYERFAVQGGDIGADVSPAVARAAPDRVVGVHVNGSIGAPFHEIGEEELASLSDVERDRVARVAAFQQEEMGYTAIQSTRPQLLGAAYVGYAQGGEWGAPEEPSGVPTGAIMFAHDIGIRRYAEASHRITRWTDVDRGGHFAALEEPALLLGDVRAFFRELR